MTTNKAEIAALEKKAREGDAEAQFKLGNLHEEGKGVPQNYREAIRRYHLAAEDGHTDARARLGKMYASGKGVPQSYSEAYVWFSLAAMDGNEEYAKERDAMAEKLTSRDISLAQGKASMLDEEARRRASNRDALAFDFSV